MREDSCYPSTHSLFNESIVVLRRMNRLTTMVKESLTMIEEPQRTSLQGDCIKAEL